MKNIRAISRERFNVYVDWTRSAHIRDHIIERNWYADTDERILGVVALDLTDNDFSYVVLGRDEIGRFRAIDMKVSLAREGRARSELKRKMAEYSKSGDSMFPQGDAEGEAFDILTPIVEKDRRHPSFSVLSENKLWTGARHVVSEMMRHFVDVDGNFVEQFQTTGFDSRLWELYLFAYFKEAGFHFDRNMHAPDFVVGRYGQKVAVEAVTVNPSNADAVLGEGHPAVWKPRDPKEISQKLQAFMPLKFGSTLYSKLSKKPPYWELEHVKGLPLIFALADFHEPQSMTWSHPAVLEYLYGVTQTATRGEDGHLIIETKQVGPYLKENGKPIQSGFFNLPDAKHVSGVLFSSTGTLSKFNRMGRIAGFGIDESRMFRMGACHHHDPDATEPIFFHFEVLPGKVSETWAEGLSLFHNPNAVVPISNDMFPGIAHHRYRDGQFRSLVPEFHPYASMTMHFSTREE
ncbi:hypothetical protein DIE23_06565 [Burkholderia sp. Bp9143]|uniref:hypothetical protein n=1 Tax=Burkholderia sp. Bp9143 TaxID=2184574 RepID=UPI000F5B2B2F|nr:hypothetical protein [Burkholderia sp. Bp9143]RQR37094.1 hypothetical protein DIE23_06565 [Burkholderia sp. Bp9143]